MADDAPRTLTWTARTGAAHAFASVLLRLFVTRGAALRVALLGATVFLVGVLLRAAFDDSTDRTLGLGRLLGAALVAGVIAALVTALCVYVGSRRTAARSALAPGAVATTTWYADSVAFQSRTTDVRISLDAVRDVTLVGDWVAIRVGDDRRWRVWPRALVPDDVLARLTDPAGRAAARLRRRPATVSGAVRRRALDVSTGRGPVPARAAAVSRRSQSDLLDQEG